MDFFPSPDGRLHREVLRWWSDPASSLSVKVVRQKGNPDLSLDWIRRSVSGRISQRSADHCDLDVPQSGSAGDIPALIGASAALLSGILLNGPIGAAKVGYVNGAYISTLSMTELATSDLELVVAGTANAVLMVESEEKSCPEERNGRRDVGCGDAWASAGMAQ